MINLKKKLKKASWIKMWYICRIEYYSFMKKKKMSFATIWMN